MPDRDATKDRADAPRDRVGARTIQSSPQQSLSLKRTISAGILSRLPYLLRPSLSGRDIGADADVAGAEKHDSPRLAMLQQRKSRSRKGSLRKTAILGTSKAKLERRTSSKGLAVLPRLETSAVEGYDGQVQESPDSDDATPRASLDREDREESSGVGIVTRSKVEFGLGISSGSEDNLTLNAVERKPHRGDISTTDDDESPTFPRTALTLFGTTSKKDVPSPYFSSPAGAVARRTRSPNPKSKSSPLAGSPLEPVGTPEEWDYGGTEWWGWVILLSTWALFVMGMGSCFGVWSWAWDVGERPDAPPELEDDATLPIVGYYPALIVLTGIVAWIWVVVAWVGMKYFRHARMVGEDG